MYNENRKSFAINGVTMENTQTSGLSNPAATSAIDNLVFDSMEFNVLDRKYSTKFRQTKMEFGSTNVKTTSVDSGNDTGNDSNDSAVTQRQCVRYSRQSARDARFQGELYGGSPAEFIRSNIEEIYLPVSSMSSDADETGYANSETQPSSSRLVANSCRALVIKTDMDNMIAKLLPFQIPYQPYEWTPYLMDNPVCGKPVSRFMNSRSMRRVMYSKDLKERRLRVAAASNNTDEVKTLLERLTEPNNRDKLLRTPLHLAAGRGYTEVVRLLLKHGAKPSLQDFIGNTPLHLAAATGKSSVVTLLLMAGADPRSLDSDGNNPLQLAEIKLRLVQDCNDADMVLIKSEIYEVINLLTAYLCDLNYSAPQIKALSTICSHPPLSNTSNQIQDEVRELLGHIDSLEIKN